jgi:invasion protein IalB
MADQHRRRISSWCNREGSLASLLLVTLASAAAAQDAAPGNTQARPEVAPRGQREAKDITYGEWRKLCFTPGGAKTICRTSITGSFPTGQIAVRVDLIEREGDNTARVQLFVPVGMFLQHPVKLTVDQGSAYQVPYTWCATNVCIAADVADPKFIGAMESGKMLALEVVDSNLLALTTSMPLAQFATVHKGAPAQTLQQDIDE